MRVRSVGLVVGVLLAGGSYLCVAQEQPTPGQKAPAAEAPAPEVQHVVIPLRNAAAADLAVALGQLFKDRPLVQVTPQPTHNALLVRAPRPEVEDLRAVIDCLDRPPRTVLVTVSIADTPPTALKKDDRPNGFPRIDTAKLSGPAEDVAAYLESLKRVGDVADLKQIDVKVLENQLGTFQKAGQKPMVTGIAAAGGRGGFGGVSTRTMQYQNIGTVLTVTPRVSGSGEVILNVKLEDSRLQTPDDAPELGTNEAGAPVRAAEMAQTSVNTSVSLPSGHATLLAGVKTGTPATHGRLLVVVSARVIADPPAR